MQERYIDFLESLPVARLGAWATTGHGPLVKEPIAKTRLELIFVKWRKSGNRLLKSALASGKKARDMGGQRQ
jgi:hypothetical protein